MHYYYVTLFSLQVATFELILGEGVNKFMCVHLLLPEGYIRYECLEHHHL